MNSEMAKRGQDESPDENKAKQAAVSHKAYTVGWVCALPKEQTAAIAMLDQRHPNIPNMQPPTDANAYTLGSIGGHNIVIACLPKGQIGVVSAATVATNMVSTFPSIKIGLMVGIGGGMPSNKVRLGDVVISTPTGTHPGVVQWDFGKAKDGGNFERTGSLNNPPTVLLAALTKLETAHEMEGSKIEEYLEELGRKFPKLASRYLRSDALRDIVFKADCAHVDMDDISSSDEDESDPCRHCDKTKAKEKRLRDTRIHYGLVASGSQVIKDGIFRDKLNKDLGGHVLCVEMEAAGLMPNFPCIVVRGICDYADSHKNKEWQEHAAAVAAACAKELLAQIEPGTIQAERSAQETLKNIQDTVSSTASRVNSLHSHLLREEDLKILDWLTPDDQGKRQSDLLSRHQMGTGQWFLDSKPFQTWLESRGETLFCPGIPGSGKTILASLVVNELSNQFLQNNTPILGYIFCDYRRQHEQGLSGLLATLLRQISRQSGSISEGLRQLHTQHTKLETRPSYAELEQTLIPTATLFPQVVFVIDALDECQAANNCRSDLISYLASVQKKANVNIMYTSRCIPDIEKRFQGCFIQHIEAKEDDVETFVHSRLSRASNPVLQAPELVNAIISTILELVNGMFLLAQLYLDALNDTTSAREVHDALLELQERKHNLAPDDENRNALYDAYDIAVERIRKQPPNFQALGMKTIMWVIFAVRPLSPKELQHALAINKGDSELDYENLRNIETILSTCAGLLIINGQSDTVRPAHFTTQEYFISKQNKYFTNAQSDITTACVTYLRFKGLWEHMCSHGWQACSDLICQLSAYVLPNWGRHARTASQSHESPTVSPIVIDLLTDERLVGYVWGSLDNHDIRFSPVRLPEPYVGAFGLHVAAHFDLVEAATDLIKLGADVDGGPEGTQTPLMVASKLGNERFVRFLLKNGVNIHKLDQYGRPAEFFAWAEDHRSVEVELRNHGASIGKVRAKPARLGGAKEDVLEWVLFRLFCSEREAEEQPRAAREEQNEHAFEFFRASESMLQLLKGHKKFKDEASRRRKVHDSVLSGPGMTKER